MKEKKSFHVQQATVDDLEQIVLFNQEMYPLRSHTLDFFKYRFLNEKTIGSLSDVVIAKHNDEIIGQRMALKNFIAYNETVYESSWVNDMIVSPGFRGMGVANGVVKKLTEIYPSFSSLNTVEQSIQMYEKIGSVRLKKLNLYFKPLNLFVFVSFLSKLIKKKEFCNNQENPSVIYPEKIGSFIRIKDIREINHPKNNWNKDWVESLRTQQYIDWRFFFKPNVYGFYQLENSTQNNEDNKSYFVIRTILWKEIKCLMMTDARYKIGSNEDILIKKAVSKIAKQNKMDAVLWGTTIPITQKNLKKAGFIKYSELPMTSNLKISDKPLNFVAHFADSDLDFNYSNTPFVYGEI